MKIGVLTSSRADFGIYQPLLRRLQTDDRFELEIIAFGTHLSPYHGYTLNNITEAGYSQIKKVYGMPLSDTPEAIANAYGLLVSNFSQYWAEHQYDLVFALGDRFEMSAAVQAGIPQQVRFAHLHGGETTLGAIDNIYRHQISLASTLHFVATEAFAKRVENLIDNNKNVHWIGALSLDDLEELPLPEWKQVAEKFGIASDKDFVLVTFHPETVNFHQNTRFSWIAFDALNILSKKLNIVITMPNADTAGSLFREQFQQLRKEKPQQVFLVENFGRLNYFVAVKQSQFLLGNSSSGIIEAASFGKYVVNVGNRQKGRAQSQNILNVPFDVVSIKNACDKILRQGDYQGQNIYYQPNTSERIINLIAHAEL